MTENAPRLLREFYDRPTLQVALELLGARLILQDGDRRLSGVITETEAYVGQRDLGCHGRSGRTERNRSMWGPAGHAYVYFTYGMHWLLNFVTEREGVPSAVLVRALLPLEGIDTMRARRKNRPLRDLANGPAKLCQAFAIDGSFDGEDLCAAESRLFLERGDVLPTDRVVRSARVGLNSVPEPWKSIPWNFRLSADLLPSVPC